MEKKNIHRSLFAFLALLSFVAFITVNMHAHKLNTPKSAGNTEQLVQSKMENDTNEDLKLPGASVVSHIISIAQRLLSLSQ
jgi:hypothetical protein